MYLLIIRGMIARCLPSQALSADEVVAGLDGPLADPHLVVAVAHHGLAALAGGAQGFLSGGGAVLSVCNMLFILNQKSKKT